MNPWPWVRRDPEAALTLALQAIIPLITLVVSVWGSFTFWAEMLGSAPLAVAVMLALEGVALIGFVMHVADLAAGHPFRMLRHVLPLLPAAPLAHTMHGVLLRSPVIGDLAAWTGAAADAAAWVGAAALTAALVGVAWWAWESLATDLRDRHAWALRRIDRDRVRAEQDIQVTLARQRAELEVRMAQAAADRESALRRLEAERRELFDRIPMLRAELVASEERLIAVETALQALQAPLPAPTPAPAPLPAPAPAPAPASLPASDPAPAPDPAPGPLPAPGPAPAPAPTPAPAPAPAGGTWGDARAPAQAPAVAPRGVTPAPAVAPRGVTPAPAVAPPASEPRTAARPPLRVVYAAPSDGDRPAVGALLETASRAVRLAYAAHLLTTTQGQVSVRQAAARCRIAPSTLGDQLRAVGADAAQLAQRWRAALAADERALLDALIAQGEGADDAS